MSIPGPVLGPAVSWLTADDVASCCGIDIATVGPSLLDTVAIEASMALYEISGRQFTGLCERTVRPCADRCGCWGGTVASSGMWQWASYPYGGWSWWNECGDKCGCRPLSKVRLSGYPVREILEVKIDGAVVDPAGYRLDGWRDLVRLDDPADPTNPRRWPGCQTLSLNDDQPGTFSVSYAFGVDPPELGRQAAAQIACQLFAACQGQECQLPAGVARVVRQGIEIERGLLANWFDKTKATGLVAVDLFLASYSATRGRRRPSVWSPDVQSYARRVGT